MHVESAIGRFIEIEAGEVRELAEYTSEMQMCVRMQPKRWLFRYLTAHKAAHKVISQVLRRSRAT